MWGRRFRPRNPVARVPPAAPPFDSASLKALPAGQKKVGVAVMTRDGTVMPADAKIVWPYFCDRM